MQRLVGVEVGGGHDPGAEAAGAVEILALGDVERAMAQPIAHAALVAQRQPADQAECLLLRDVAAFLADHQHDLALVVEFLRHFWTHDRLLVANQRGREAAKQVRIFRRLAAVLVLGAALGIVDADADDFFRREQRRQHLDIFDVVVRLPGRRGARLGERAAAKHVEQGRIFRESFAEIDNAAVGHHPVAHAAVCLEGCQS